MTDITAPLGMTKFLAHRCVLVVEDEMLVAMLIEDFLGDLGCENVFTAATVDQALHLIGVKRFDVAMLDMNLAGRRSDVVADALAAREVPFVFATGYGTHGLTDPHRNRPVLQKPFQQRELVTVLEALLDASSPT